MKSEMIIDIFRPECFSKVPTNTMDLNNLYGKKWHYASKGRYALYHILKHLGVEGRMLIPVYVCDTVLIPLRLLGIEPVFYDIRLDDLNADVASIEKLGKKYDVSAVLVVSMYGNPADYPAIEKLCKDNNWFMIDDAAQSIGAELDGRQVGTFGDAGFYSFSPGKPTAGPMGAFYWINKEIGVDLGTNHDLFHKLIYYDFYYNRVQIYEDISVWKRKPVNYFCRLLGKVVNIVDDNIASFELSYLSDIFVNSLGGYTAQKSKYIKKIVDSVHLPRIRFVTSLRGKPNSYKLVVIAESRHVAQHLIEHLTDNKIYASNGYKMLTDDFRDTPNAQRLNGCVVEIPVECVEFKVKYLIDVLQKLS